MLLWSLWPEPSAEEAFEESTSLRERTDRQEPCRWPPSRLQADVVRFGVSVPYPWKQPRSSSDLICAALGSVARFARGGVVGPLHVLTTASCFTLKVLRGQQHLRGMQSLGPA